MSALAQTTRIQSPIDESRRITLAGTVHPRTRSALDLGPVERSRPIGPLAILLKRTPEQKEAVRMLLESQRDRASASFHQWLTPERVAGSLFAGRPGGVARRAAHRRGRQPKGIAFGTAGA